MPRTGSQTTKAQVQPTSNWTYQMGRSPTPASPKVLSTLEDDPDHPMGSSPNAQPAYQQQIFQPSGSEASSPARDLTMADPEQDMYQYSEQLAAAAIQASRSQAQALRHGYQMGRSPVFGSLPPEEAATGSVQHTTHTPAEPSSTPSPVKMRRRRGVGQKGQRRD
jgi:hypothetical protein